MFRLRPLFWPTLISLPIFVFTLGLGVWQMERREWKRDILDRIAVNQAVAPMPLDELLKGDPLRREYGRATVSGTFLHDKEFPLGARSRKNEVGLQIVTPLRTDDGTQFYARVIEDCGRCAFFVGIGYLGNDRRRIQLRCGYGAPPAERRPAVQAPIFGPSARRQIVAGS